MRVDDDFKTRLDRLLGMRSGRAQVTAFAEAVRGAEAAGETSHTRAARWGLLYAAVGSDVGDEFVLPTFARLLADFDADPAGCAADDCTPALMLAAYTEVLRYATRFPSIPRDRVAALLDDFEARAGGWGGGPDAALEVRLHARADLGDLEAVPGLLRELLAARAGREPARTRRDEALAAIYTVNGARAAAAMGPALDGEADVPDDLRSTFLAWALRPLVWCGQEARADGYYRRALAAPGDWLFGEILVLEYAARRRDEEALRNRLPRLMAAAPHMGPDFRMQAAAAAGLACEVLAELGDAPRRLPLPGDAGGGSLRRPSEAAPRLAETAAGFAAALDDRNGNDHVSRQFVGNRDFVLNRGSGLDRVPADRRARLDRLWEEEGPPTGGPP